MRHPAEGVLRRLLDEPSGVAVADREHVRDCAQCLADVDAMREDAALVQASLANDIGNDVDVADAWRRFSTAPPAKAATVARPRERRVAAFLRRPSVAGVAFAVVVSGAGLAAANDWLPIFRTERVQPVSIGTGDLVALPDLSSYGTLAFSGEPDVREVPDAAAAKAATGIDVPSVRELPRGVAGEPTYSVGAKVSATFTFSAERAARAVTGAGALPPVPPGLDGSSVRLDVGPGVLQHWQSSSGVPALVVGRAVAPTAFSSGVPFETVRDYLLSLPGIPDRVAAQLRAFTADGSTFPLPVPADQVVTTTATIGGARATIIGTRDGTLAAVVWVRGGMLNVVGGAFDRDDLVAIAEELA